MYLRIAKLRVQRGWTKSELARQAHIAGSDLSKIESGRLVPYAAQLCRLAVALGVPADEAHTLLAEVQDND